MDDVLLGAGLGLLVSLQLGPLSLLLIRTTLRSGLAAGRDVPGRLLPALRLSLAATAANPLTVASWAAVFAAASTGARTRPALLAAGVGLGSLTWVLLLAGGTALLRRAVSARGVRLVDVLAGAGLVGFGLVSAARVLR